MKDHLMDLVKHTHDLGTIGLIKITGDDITTSIDGMADDQTVVLNAKFSSPIAEFNGVFGMPNLNNLKTILNTQEYKSDAAITVTRQDRNEENIPVGLHFDNKNSDFSNDYRFMSSEMVQEQLNVGTFKGAKWDVTIGGPPSKSLTPLPLSDSPPLTTSPKGDPYRPSRSSGRFPEPVVTRGTGKRRKER